MADGGKFLVNMGRAHPTMLWSALCVLDRRISHGWIQTVQVPMQATVIARNDFATSKRRFTALEAKDWIVLRVLDLESVRMDIIIASGSAYSAKRR